MKIIHKDFLPTFTRSVHASTIEFWKDRPIFAWFGGTQEGHSDVSIYICNLFENKVIKLENKDGIPRWNPIILNWKDKLFLFEKRGIFCDRWQTFIHDMSDWDLNEKLIENNYNYILPAGLNGPVKSRPLIKGDLIYCGSSFETIYDWSSYIETYSLKNGMITFEDRSHPLIEKEKKDYKSMYEYRNKTLGIIQPTLFEKDNKIYALFRSSQGLNKIYLSYNDGSGWSDPKPTNLNNPNSSVDIVTVNGELYLIWNPDCRCRYPLVLSHIDFGENYYDIDIKKTICIDDSLDYDNFYENSCNSPELSYPYMIVHNNKIHITYTYGRSKIAYVVVDI
jgi:predicted neuraminidase